MPIYGVLSPPIATFSQSDRSAPPLAPPLPRPRARSWSRPLPEPAVPGGCPHRPWGDIGDIGDTGVALGQALLCVTSLGCALRARKVTGGPAAGFLLQALAAAGDALSPSCPRGVPEGDAAVPGSWLGSVLAQPLVAFGCHLLGGDRATANLLLASATSAAAAACWWRGDGRVLACHFVTALTAGSLLALAALTGSVTRRGGRGAGGAWGRGGTRECPLGEGGGLLGAVGDAAGAEGGDGGGQVKPRGDIV
ncbi:transmembrane protein 276 [Chamaea fasciata]|uniref:transmembrane protein 276 n=1 Tax=Chamaea fasciata TaxID=190680 RepID=UPI003369C96E